MELLQIQKPSANGHRDTRSIGVIKKIGLAIFLIGMGVFIITLGLSDYQITYESLQSIANKIRPEALESIEPIQDQTFASKFRALNAIEEQIKQENSLSDYDRGIATFWILKASATGTLRDHALLFFFLSMGLICIGGLTYFFAQWKASLPGIKNNHIYSNSVMSRGLIGIILGAFLIGFYVLLYWFPELIVNMVILVDPISEFIRGQQADQWFLYGVLYTLAVTVMGVRMMIKYRHSRYHLVRTLSVIFFQLGFAFLIPSLLERLSQPSMDLKNAWPLNYSFFADWNLNNLINGGNLGIFMLFWGVILAVVVVPLMTYFFGKRWYCSWVCGCGGLAETLGDPFRQLSDKSLGAWKVERWLIHSVLIFAVVMTAIQITNYVSNGAVFGDLTWRVNQAYSFLIGSAFAGVVGTGFYPLMGNRVWCRFGCPLAAILGLVQKYKSRFRITTNGGQCISCGNCSTYCEMGIDVRWYAQRGQNIIRSSCVGCGVCATVCPRGVLRLENGPEKGRYDFQLNESMR